MNSISIDVAEIDIEVRKALKDILNYLNIEDDDMFDNAELRGKLRGILHSLIKRLGE